MAGEESERPAGAVLGMFGELGDILEQKRLAEERLRARLNVLDGDVFALLNAVMDRVEALERQGPVGPRST